MITRQAVASALDNFIESLRDDADFNDAVSLHTLNHFRFLVMRAIAKFESITTRFNALQQARALAVQCFDDTRSVEEYEKNCASSLFTVLVNNATLFDDSDAHTILAALDFDAVVTLLDAMREQRNELMTIESERRKHETLKLNANVKEIALNEDERITSDDVSKVHFVDRDDQTYSLCKRVNVQLSGRRATTEFNEVTCSLCNQALRARHVQDSEDDAYDQENDRHLLREFQREVFETIVMQLNARYATTSVQRDDFDEIEVAKNSRESIVITFNTRVIE